MSEAAGAIMSASEAVARWRRAVLRREEVNFNACTGIVVSEGLFFPDGACRAV